MDGWRICSKDESIGRKAEPPEDAQAVALARDGLKPLRGTEAFDTTSELDLLEWESNTCPSLGYKYGSKKGDPGVFAAAKATTNAILMQYIEASNKRDFLRRRVTPDIVYSRTQMSQLSNPKVRAVHGRCFHLFGGFAFLGVGFWGLGGGGCIGLFRSVPGLWFRGCLSASCRGWCRVCRAAAFRRPRVFLPHVVFPWPGAWLKSSRASSTGTMLRALQTPYKTYTLS